jgi:hypothetical protein
VSAWSRIPFVGLADSEEGAGDFSSDGESFSGGKGDRSVDSVDYLRDIGGCSINL